MFLVMVGVKERQVVMVFKWVLYSELGKLVLVVAVGLFFLNGLGPKCNPFH